MTTYDLMIIVKETLEKEGFETSSEKLSVKEFSHHGTATKDGKSYRKPVEGFTFTHLTGYTIDFDVVHRHNGTDENKSVDIKIMKWKSSNGRSMVKERLNVNYSEKQIQNRIRKIIDQYNAIEV